MHLLVVHIVPLPEKHGREDGWINQKQNVDYTYDLWKMYDVKWLMGKDITEHSNSYKYNWGEKHTCWS